MDYVQLALTLNGCAKASCLQNQVVATAIPLWGSGQNHHFFLPCFSGLTRASTT